MSLQTPQKNIKRQRKGVVVSTKMNKTVVVALERSALHPKYLKRYRIVKKVKAHDEKNECQEGDLVTIEECRPLSREKHWRVIVRSSKTKS